MADAFARGPRSRIPVRRAQRQRGHDADWLACRLDQHEADLVTIVDCLGRRGSSGRARLPARARRRQPQAQLPQQVVHALRRAQRRGCQLPAAGAAAAAAREPDGASSTGLSYSRTPTRTSPRSPPQGFGAPMHHDGLPYALRKMMQRQAPLSYRRSIRRLMLVSASVRCPPGHPGTPLVATAPASVVAVASARLRTRWRRPTRRSSLRSSRPRPGRASTPPSSSSAARASATCAGSAIRTARPTSGPGSYAGCSPSGSAAAGPASCTWATRLSPRRPKLDIHGKWRMRPKKPVHPRRQDDGVFGWAG